MEPLEGSSLLEEVNHWGQALRTYSHAHFLFILSVSYVQLKCDQQLPAPVTCCHAFLAIMMPILEPLIQLNASFALVMVFNNSN